MDKAPTFGRQDIVASIVDHAAAAVSQRPGATRQDQDARAHAIQTIMALQPGDAIEAMIASHCVILHELIVAEVNHTLSDEEPSTQRAARSRIIAMDRAFGSNLTRLGQRRTARQPETPPVEDDCTGTNIAERIQRHLPQAEPGNQDTAAASQPANADAIADAWQTVAQMAGLNRQARRALDRQTSKRALGFPRAGATPDRNAASTTPSAMPAG